jgi:hypothetical protein
MTIDFPKLLHFLIFFWHFDVISVDYLFIYLLENIKFFLQPPFVFIYKM